MKAPRTWCSRIGIKVRGGIVASLLASLVLLAGAPVGAANANFHLGKTVTRASDTPVLGLSLAVDRSAAIPHDTLTYTAVVSNTGSLLTLAGDLTVQNTDATAATIAYYSDVLSTAANSHCGAGGDNSGQNETPQWASRNRTANHRWVAPAPAVRRGPVRDCRSV